MKRAGILGISLILMLAVVAACAPKVAPPPAPAEKPPIKIGALLDYTGASRLAPFTEKGIELRLDEAGWEVAGRKIELIKEDMKFDPVIAVDKARKLVEYDKVNVLIGPISSAAGFAVAGYREPFKVPNITIFDHQVEIAKYKGIINPGGAMDWYDIGLGRYAFEKLGYRTVSFLAPDYVAGRMFADSFMTGFGKAGGTLHNETWYPLDAIDFTPFLMRVGKPDCLHTFFLSTTAVMRFVSQYQELGLKIPVLACRFETWDLVLPELGDFTLDVVGSACYTWRFDHPENKRFVEAFEKKYGAKPTGFNARSYISTSVFLEAVRLTGGDTTPDKINPALLRVNIDTPGGPLQIDEKGFAHQLVFISKGAKVNGVYALEVLDSYPSEPEE